MAMMAFHMMVLPHGVTSPAPHWGILGWKEAFYHSQPHPHRAPGWLVVPWIANSEIYPTSNHSNMDEIWGLCSILEAHSAPSR